MIGDCSSVCCGAFNHVETIHFGAARFYSSSFRKVVDIPQSAGTARQKIGIDREDDVSLVEAIDRVYDFTEGEARARLGIVAIYRLVLMPLG